MTYLPTVYSPLYPASFTLEQLLKSNYFYVLIYLCLYPPILSPCEHLPLLIHSITIKISSLTILSNICQRKQKIIKNEIYQSSSSNNMVSNHLI